MQSEWSAERVEDDYVWHWRIEYRKFRSGNQKSAEEKPTGADGIFQVEVERFRIAVSPSDLIHYRDWDVVFSGDLAHRRPAQVLTNTNDSRPTILYVKA
jgi:hypothetical protein